MRCGGCQTVSYCNAEYQRTHWKVHKKTCTASAAASAAQDLTAALAGDHVAQYNIGLSYASGMGVSQDLSEAVRWYRKAADAGNVNAQFNLAKCYRQGTGVKVDLEEAFRWTRAPADAGHTMSQYCLGLCYLIGDGVAKKLNDSVY